ncbi:hypothetical protein AVEN_198762-1 [Araneus ventricosus]|uniref:Thyroglobulin type-1 domain-containing protein n=1 Tax=Araneus ventricosus TaxID=182803 RepID=A0A4Y2KHR1_ARAVE|nr:hypothetical protein AVEN_198762-1 [Araneus ventricosus]
MGDPMYFGFLSKLSDRFTRSHIFNMMRQLFLIVLALAVLAQIAHGEGNCAKERNAIGQNVAPGQFVPRCDSNGDYKKAQCNDGAYCYCVDTKTGKQMGKSKRFGIKCD